LNVERRIHILTIPVLSGFSSWQGIARFFAVNATITHLHSEDRWTPDFGKFAGALAENSRLALTTFTLSRMQIGPRQADQLVNIIKVGKLEKVHLAKATFTSGAADFLRKLGSEKNMPLLRELSLERSIKTINLSVLTPFLHIGDLVLDNSGVELSTIIAFLGRQTAETFQVQGVSVSGNPANQPIPNVQLPRSLSRFVAHVVFFTESTLSSLLSVLVARPLSVDLSYAIAEREKWNEVFEALDRIPEPRLRHLTWIDNPISPVFFGFLARCSRLTVLDLTGCLSPLNPAFDAAIDFLGSNQTIGTLHVGGSRKNVLSGSALMSVIGILRTNTAVSVLDLRNNVIEAAQLPEFADILIGNATLTKLAFSVIGIADPEALTAFWHRLLQRGPPLTVRVKYADMPGRKDQSVSDEQVAAWKRLQDEIARGGAGRAGQSPISEIGDWAVLQPPLPQVDNAGLLEQKGARFNVSVLWGDLNMSDPE
jgi:hypothetical protein